ncbi:hypothetical protein BMS97_06130 [Leuconostoc mesenteroides subsp. mesenteroides]|uniref:hypothetical protein n=1 Tax=Leuconostoc mesenteroides TaxID=1245 RepID=UPI0009FFC163|nr:hypothetical protein [Leuconostoc mesenteroides]ARN63719.1 hypothetical protein A0F18_06635 [Leuconostoc mesenteroides subsp. mesenteroides]MDV8928416.1 hypothetical protein [Leuconostoc mesenteroides]ORI89602.1 hypothetical protein BMS97_06130 [Leuconostoc mesenteroides subsp. mesenteroides]ORI93105.1 hypothetical protein BMS98_02070 [Leuconostoc mesenteroides subsp. mesenteroides]
MAINITSLIIKSEDFIIGKKTYTACYTPEIDEKYSDLMLKTGDLYRRVEKYDEDATLDEQRKLVSKSYKEMSDNSKEYLEAAIGKKEADEIARYADNRAVTIVKIAQAVFEAGQSDELKQKYGSNRSQRRSKGND